MMSKTEVRTRVHSNMLTQQRSKFINEYGRYASHILFCEFIDNSIQALHLSKVLKSCQPAGLSTIEVHLIFSWEPTKKLTHIAVFDRGPGMSDEALVGWSEMGKPAEQREEHSPGANELRLHNQTQEAPFQADGQLGFFGKGSKAAGFFYGECVTAVTKRSRDEPTRELRFDALKMRAAEAQHQEWDRNFIVTRHQGRDAILATDHWRDECPALLALLEAADAHASYSLFVVSRIHDSVAGEIDLHSVPAIASELRDVYYVYCDGLERGLQRMQERSSEGTAGTTGRTACFPSARFKYSPLDVHIVTHMSDRPEPESRFSIRDEPMPEPEGAQSVYTLVEEARAALAAPRIGYDVSEDQRQLIHAQRFSPNEVVSLAAPEPFLFRFKHRAWGRVSGMALYLPFADGGEVRERLALHDNSRAICFWAGRLMPYCKLPALLPWMEWASRKGDVEIATRVVVFLFFGQVAAVDDTKFRLGDDILNDLKKNDSTSSEWESWRQDKPGSWSWQRTPHIGRGFKKWNETAHAKYDEHCELRDPLPEAIRRDDREYAVFKTLQYGSSSSQNIYRSGDLVKVRLALLASYSGGKQAHFILGRIRHFLMDKASIAKDTGNHTCATCEVVVAREPVALYSSEHLEVVRASALVTKDAVELKKLENEELKKAPMYLDASFTGLKGGVAPGLSSGNQVGTLASTPLRVTANEPVPDVLVRPINALNSLVCDWRHVPRQLKSLKVKQSVSFSELMDRSLLFSDSAHSGSVNIPAASLGDFGDPPAARDGSLYRPVVNESHWKPDGAEEDARGFYFNNGDHCRLSFWKAGLYRLTYSVAPLRGGGHRSGEAELLHAELFVLVTPALVVRLQCELAPPHDARPVRLGEPLPTPDKLFKGCYGVQVNVLLRDGDGECSNTRLVWADQLKQMVDTSKDNGEEEGSGLLMYPNDELMKHPALITGVAKLGSGEGKRSARSTRDGCRLFVGLHEGKTHITKPEHCGEGYLTGGLWPSTKAVREHLFSRHTPRFVQMEVALKDCPGATAGAPRGSIKFPVVSAAPLRLRLASTAAAAAKKLPTAAAGPPWLHTSAGEALNAFGAPRNFAPLPEKIAIALRDDFECALPVGCVVRLSAACVSPDGAATHGRSGGCAGLDGASAGLNAAGLAVFRRLTPCLASLGTCAVSAPSAAGGDPIRGALVRLTFTAAIGTDDSETVPATTEDAVALASEADEIATLSIERFLFLAASRVPAMMELRRAGEILHADRNGEVALTGDAGSTLADVTVSLLNEAGDVLSWEEVEDVGHLMVDGKKIDGRKPLKSLKLPNSVEDAIPYRITFEPSTAARETAPSRSPTLEVRLILKAYAGKPVRWHIRRRDPVRAAAGRRAAAGPIDLCVGQRLHDAFSVALVDDKGNACQLDESYVPIVSIRSGSDAAGPWFVRSPEGGGAAAEDGPLRMRELLLPSGALDPEARGKAVWQFGTGSLDTIAIVGRASSSETPEEMLFVAGVGELAESATASFTLKPGPPHSLELEPKSKNYLCTRDLRTRERFASLVFVVHDAGGNAVPVETLLLRSFSAATPARVTVTHQGPAEREGQHGFRWSLKEVRLSADRAVHSAEGAASQPVRHSLVFHEPPVAKINGTAYSLQWSPVEIKTCLQDEFVVDVRCTTDMPAEVTVGYRLDPFKVMLRLEDGTQCSYEELQLRVRQELRRRHADDKGQKTCDVADEEVPEIESVRCILTSPDGGKRALSRVDRTALFKLPPDEAELTLAGKYTCTVTYTEQRPRLIAAIGGTAEAKLVRTAFELTLNAGPAMRLRLARALPRLKCDNTCNTQVFEELDVHLLDQHGNLTSPNGALCGASLVVALAPLTAGMPDSTAAANGSQLPRIEGVASAAIESSSSKVSIGPVAIVRGSGRGDQQLRVVFRLMPSTEGDHHARAAESLVITLPDELAVEFTDSQSLDAEEARARDVEAAEHRRLQERHKQLTEACRNKRAQIEQESKHSANLSSEAGAACHAMASSVAHIVRSYLKLASWTATLTYGDGGDQLRHDMQSPINQWDSKTLVHSMSMLLSLEPRELERLHTLILQSHSLVDWFNKLHKSSADVDSLSRQALKLDPEKNVQCVEELANTVETLCGHLDRQSIPSVHGLSHAEVQVLDEYQKMNERNREECLGPIAELFVVPYIGPESRKIAAVLSAIAGQRNLLAILVSDGEAYNRIRSHSQYRDVPLNYHVLDMTNPDVHTDAITAVPNNSFAHMAFKLARPHPQLPANVAQDIEKVLLDLFRNTVIVSNEQEAILFSQKTRGRCRVVALDGFEIIGGSFSDRPDGRVSTELLDGRAHFAVDTSTCPLHEVALHVSPCTWLCAS